MARDRQSRAKEAAPALVPLFPLPNIVLFPRAVLPLHIFEERYRRMTADALASHRQVAMALLRPGWEKDYYGRPAIEPVVCIGTIISHERLPDGRYNFLLQGHTRARVVREEKRGEAAQAYRAAELDPLEETAALEIDLGEERRRLNDLFADDAFIERVPGGPQFREMLRGEAPTAAVADLLAFHLLGSDDLELKQSLLAEEDVRRRVARIARAVESLGRIGRGPPDPSVN